MELLKKIISSRRLYLLLALFLSAYITLSLIVVVNRDFSTFLDVEMEQFILDQECIIEDYELSCNRDEIILVGVLIDLTDTPIEPTGDQVVLTKHSLEAVGFSMTYQDFLTQVGHTSSIFTYEDAKLLADQFLQGMKAFLSIIGVLALWLGVILNTHVYALVEQMIFTRKKGQRVAYAPIYRATMIGWTPIIILNGIARMAFGTSIKTVIRTTVPFGWLILFALEIIIIYYISNKLLQEEEQVEIL